MKNSINRNKALVLLILVSMSLFAGVSSTFAVATNSQSVDIAVLGNAGTGADITNQTLTSSYTNFTFVSKPNLFLNYSEDYPYDEGFTLIVVAETSVNGGYGWLFQRNSAISAYSAMAIYWANGALNATLNTTIVTDFNTPDFRIIRNATEVYWFIDGELQATRTDSYPLTAMYVSIQHSTNSWVVGKGSAFRYTVYPYSSDATKGSTLMIVALVPTFIVIGILGMLTKKKLTS